VGTWTERLFLRLQCPTAIGGRRYGLTPLAL